MDFFSNNQSVCRFCNESPKETFDIFGVHGVRLKVFSVLSKHFSFLQIHNNGTDETCICNTCWTVIQDFNNLYEKIKKLWSTVVVVASSTTNKTTNVHCDPDFPIKIEIGQNSSEILENPCIKLESPDKTVTLIHSSALDADNENVRIREDSDPIAFDDNTNISDFSTVSSLKSDISSSGSSSASIKKRVVKIQRKLKVAKSKADVINKKADLSKIELAEKELRQKNHDAMNRTILEHFSLDCKDCSHSSTTFLNFATHCKNVHNKRGFVYCCNKKFSRRSKMLDHISYHLDPESFKCNECNKSFATKCSHRKHMESHVPSSERQFKCTKCPLTFSKSYILNQHLRRGHTDQLFSCDICDKTFTTKYSAKAHVINTHVGTAPITEICHICAKTYKSKASLQLHIMETHNVDPNRPKLSCNICGACFSNEMYLKRHAKLHTESNVKCPVCDKVSPSKSAMRCHMRYMHAKHTHKCSICEKTFARPLGLKEHMASHTGQDLYSCQLCTRTFKSRANMHSHRKKVHPIEWNADRLLRRNNIL